MNDSKIKIGLVTVYLGTLPWYFELFLKSCESNDTIHFIFITDQDRKNYPSLPQNVKWIFSSQMDLEGLISSQLGLHIKLEYAYKLCDLKPAYGVIFEELLKGYNFWGHCDIDVIYGRIRKFITDEILSAHEIISVTKDYVSGFFTLFKNTPFISHLFENSKDYKLIFESKKHFCFDECNNLYQYLIAGRSIFELPSEIESMTHVVRRLEKEDVIKPYFNQFAIEALPGNMHWNNGQLIIARKYEALLYHLIEFKRLTYSYHHIKKNVPDTFYIERFYLSKFSPDSAFGKISKIYFTGLRNLALFIKRKKYSAVSTLKVKDSFSLDVKKYSGVYTQLVPTKIKTEIRYQDGQFEIKFYGHTDFYPLLHIKNHIFFCSATAIEIRFGYSIELEKHFIYGANLYNDTKSKEFLQC